MVIGVMYGGLLHNMDRKRVECSSCDAIFWVEHDMDAHYYPIKHCTFCAAELDLEEELELDYGEEFDV